MSHYFHISNGLRGCYMPDSAYVICVDTRRELVNVLEDEALSVRDAEFVGASKRDVRRIAAAIWRDRTAKRERLDFCVPYGNRRGNSSDYAFGIFVSHATRADWKEQENM